jgi:hypothetical protein
MPAVDEDRFLYWPVATAVACAVAVVLAWANLFFGSLLLVTIVLLFWAGMGVRVVITCAAWWRARAWRRFYSATILPVTALVMVVCFAPPPNSKKLWSTQKREPSEDQSLSDPNGDAPPWTPSPFVPIIPEPILPPLIEPFPFSIPPVLVPG